MSAADVLLEAHSLSRSLSDQAQVQDVSLTLRRGDVLGLLGLNGAGKSTTLRMLCGVLVPDAGHVTIAGHSLADDPLRARARIGFLPDQPPLYADMRVENYLQLCAKLRRIDKASVNDRVTAIIDRCDLGSVRRQRIAKLSKGYRQRVGLAQALVHQPDVVLLDEPSNGLDPQQMQSMRTLIKSVGAEHCVIFSTHLLAEARAVCNRIAVMHDGRLIADQTTGHDDAQLETLFDQLVRDDPQQQSVGQAPERPAISSDSNQADTA